MAIVPQRANREDRMTTEKPPFYITTPIYYVNGTPHIGHVYTSVACDVMARFKRLDGYDVKFLTGTDEHGLKVKQSADKQGVSPQKFVDDVSQTFEDVLTLMNISHDDFIRTTQERHIKSAQHFWTQLEKEGMIYAGNYSGWYSVRDEAYYTESELTTCPDNKEIKIAPTGATCEWVEEESYFFKLSAYGDKLLDFYEKNPDFIQPNSIKNEIISFVKRGLKDLSISRTSFDWGIPVPNHEQHIMYVWIDALTNYITALGYPDKDTSDFQKFWPANVHMVGKEITRFHCIFWPAFLMAADLPLPHTVFAHGWWTVEGEKMSKSLGNVIHPKDLVDRYGVDQSRYFLLKAIPFGNDGNFSHDQAITRINADLANGLGNLVQRTLSMVYKNCETVIPERVNLTPEDAALLEQSHSTIHTIRPLFDQFQYHRALEEIWRLVSAANTYVDEQAPWALKKTDFERMKVVLAVLVEVIRCLGLLTQPFMPDSASKILDQLKIPADQREFKHLTQEYAIGQGTCIDLPEGIFPRIMEEEKTA